LKTPFEILKNNQLSVWYRRLAGGFLGMAMLLFFMKPAPAQNSANADAVFNGWTSV